MSPFSFSLEFFGCLGRLYACEEAGKVKCPNTERCIPLQPVVSEVEEEETREQQLKHREFMFQKMETWKI